jgi:branched-chain amino acid transport system permease protein
VNWESFFLTVLTLSGIFGVLTLALNLQFGFAGLINFGIVAYFAVGAYTYVILTQPPPDLFDQYAFGFDLPMWAGFLGAGIAATLFALVTGWPCLRLRGEYLALTTFAFAEVLHSFIVNERALSNGTVGFSGLRPPLRDVIAGDAYAWLFCGAILAFLVLMFVVMSRLANSPFGRTLKAMRDDELSAELAGKSTQRMRLQAFLVGALFVGFAGVFYVWFTTLIRPTLFTAGVTFTVWIAFVLGGGGSNLRPIWSNVGAIVGIFILIGFEEIIRFVDFDPNIAARVSAIRVAVLGLLFIAVLRVRAQLGEGGLGRLARRTGAGLAAPGGSEVSAGPAGGE